MTTVLYGRDRSKKYELDKKINKGGEGTVYSIVGHSSLVAKIYNDERLSDKVLMKATEEKILAMLNMNFDPRINGKLVAAWPVDALYDVFGSFFGFVMPKIENMKSLIWAMRPSDRDALWPKGYRWRNSIAIAFNLSYVIEKLHASGIVVGDMNTNNILIDAAGDVTLIDAGSFNIKTKEGKLYKCIVGFPEVLPPELQGKDLTKPNNQFSEKTDCFALAIHIFTLLNNNCHPFGCLDYNTEHASSSSPKIMDNIVKGFCPYVSGKSGNTVEDSLGMDVFTNEINTLFKRAFYYDATTAVRQSTIANRPTAKEWREALSRFYDAGFITCINNPHHEFSAKYRGGCPWCAIELRKRNNSGTGKGSGAGTGAGTGTQKGTGTHTPSVNHVTIPVYYCDLDGNKLRTSQIDVEYGKTGYAYSINIQGYHLKGDNPRKTISVDQNGNASQKEIRFAYEKDGTKKKKKHRLLRFFCILPLLYGLIMYGMIKTAVDGSEYEKALENMGMFPFYNELFPKEYNEVKNEVEKKEEQALREKYNRAVRYYKNGEYSKAYNLFTDISSSFQSTELYITFCKAHMYKATDYFTTIYKNLFFEDAKDLLTLNADIFGAYMEGNWTCYPGPSTVTMDSDCTVHGMPEAPEDGYYTVEKGIWKYIRKDDKYYTDYFTIEIKSASLFQLHPIRNKTEYTLYRKK